MSDAAPQELGVLAKLVMVLGMVLIVAGVVWHGVTGEVLRQFWHDLIERPDGPMRFRFFLQPLMAAIAAIHDGRGDATVPDYEAGFKTAGSLGLTAYTNNGTAPTPGVAVTMAAATTNFGYSGTASPTPTKAASTLQWSINSGGTWNNMTTAGGTVLTAPGATAGTNQTVIFRTGLSWTADPPGTYTLTLNFTITAP